MKPAVELDVWDIEGRYGPERWQLADGRFASVTVGDKQISINQKAPDPDLAQLFLRKGVCDCEGPWPSTFSFCPSCGLGLTEPTPRSGPECWSPPFGAANGLPVLQCDAKPVTESKSQQPVPAASNLSFIVAGTPSGLFCYDHNTGSIKKLLREDAFSTTIGVWLDVARVSTSFRLPRWSWGAIATEIGFALPTDSGLYWIDLKPTHKREIFRSSETLDIGNCLGGIAAARGAALVPVDHHGRLSIVVFSREAGRWMQIEVIDAPLVESTPAYFAVPVVHDQEVFWVSKQGQLYADVERSTATYTAWPDDFSPHVEIRPLWTPDGSLYQQGRAGSQIVYQKICRPGALAQRIVTRSYAINMGKSLFSNGKRYQSLEHLERGDFKAEYILDDGEFVSPLLAFDENRYLLAICPGRDTLRDFIGINQQKTSPRQCKLIYSGATRNMAALGQSVRASTIYDIITFIYDLELYVYSALDNSCSRWPLSLM